MRVLPRRLGHIASAFYLAFMSVTVLGSTQGCNSEPKKQQLAPIYDSQHPGPAGPAVQRQIPPPVPIARPVYKPPMDQDSTSFMTKYFGYGWAHNMWSPEKGLAGKPAPFWVLVTLVLGLLFGAFFSQRFRKYRVFIYAAIAIVLALFIMLTSAPLAYVGWFALGFAITWLLFRILLGPGA